MTDFAFCTTIPPRLPAPPVDMAQWDAESACPPAEAPPVPLEREDPPYPPRV